MDTPATDDGDASAIDDVTITAVVSDGESPAEAVAAATGGDSVSETTVDPVDVCNDDDDDADEAVTTGAGEAAAADDEGSATDVELGVT